MINIEGTPLSAFNISVDFYGEEVITPEVRTAFKDRGAYGSVNHGAIHGNKVFTIPCILQGERQLIQPLLALFLDDNGNYKREVKLQYRIFPGRYWLVTLASPIRLMPERQGVFRFDFELVASYPFAIAEISFDRYFESVNIDPTVGFEVPVDYNGTYHTGFTFSFFGTLSYLSVATISNDGVRHGFNFNPEGSKSTYLVVDFEDMTVSDNGNNGLLDSTGRFLTINRNTKHIVFRGVASGSLSIKYQEKYV